jgi:KDO2-lipid IV(A) lauroyltransferase
MIIFSFLLYYLILIPFSLLPFGVMYALSDFLYLVLYRISGYRKKVVLQNIQRSFPQKSREEHQRIMDLFYHHLCDLVVESVKIFTISEKQVLKRMTCRNPEVLNRYFDQNKSVILAGGHYNNWELFAVAVHKFIRHKPVGIYKPLSSAFFNRKMLETRGKFGLEMLSTKDVRSFFEERSKELTATIFAIDQSPGKAKSAYWMTFLNQETAVLFGMEKYAVEYNLPVIFGRLKKLKRGHYELEFEEITTDPAQMAYGKLTEKATKMIEADIIHAPEFWLWSHKRWKKKREEAA